jgi:flagellar basal-body rod protein FlgC
MSMDALSGMSAAQTMFAASANNVANVNTDGYDAQRANLATTATGGVSVASIGDSGGGGVDLGAEMPGQAMAEVAYTALARVIRVQDQTMSSLIDMLA